VGEDLVFKTHGSKPSKETGDAVRVRAPDISLKATGSQRRLGSKNE
jgi:hypothetical protein